MVQSNKGFQISSKKILPCIQGLVSNNYFKVQCCHWINLVHFILSNLETLFQGVPSCLNLNLPEKIVTGTRVIVWDGEKKYNLVSVYDWLIIMIGPGGLLLEDLSPICNPRFSFFG